MAYFMRALVAPIALIWLWTADAWSATPCRLVEEPPAAERADPVKDRWITVEVAAPGLHQRLFHSTAAGTAVSYHVLLPPGYDADPARRFPVLFWLHGTGGGLSRLATNAARFDAAMRAGDMPPMVVVYPYGLPAGMWVDSKDGATPIESILVRDLIPHVDACYRTVAAREGRIIEGYSMGGYGAARIGLRYPQLFAGILMWAAGPLQEELRVTPRASAEERARLMRTVYGDDMGYFREQSPWLQAQRAVESGVPLPRLRVIVGTADETYPANRKFHEHLERLGLTHDYVEIPGVGHSLPALWSALGDDAWAFYGLGSPR
jgi:enterochelin esterase-like enzyme